MGWEAWSSHQSVSSPLSDPSTPSGARRVLPASPFLCPQSSGRSSLTRGSADAMSMQVVIRKKEPTREKVCCERCRELTHPSLSVFAFTSCHGKEFEPNHLRIVSWLFSFSLSLLILTGVGWGYRQTGRYSRSGQRWIRG